MLLRASRSAGYLTKEAIIGMGLRAAGRFTAGVGRGLLNTATKSTGVSGKLGRGVGGLARRNWKVLGGGAMVGMGAAPSISQGLQKARVGMNPSFIQAQQRGYAPQLRATS